MKSKKKHKSIAIVLLVISFTLSTFSVFTSNVDAATVGGVTFDVNVASHSTCSTSVFPTTYSSSAIVDMTAPTTNQKRCAVLNVHLENQSSGPIKNANVRIDLPQIGQFTSGELFGGGGATLNPKFNGNTMFPQSNFKVVGNSNLNATTPTPIPYYVTFNSATTLGTGASSDVQVLLQYTDGAVSIGNFDYKASVTYDDKDNKQQSQTDSANVEIIGEKQKVPANIGITKNGTLNYYPSESDATSYFYQQYTVTGLNTVSSGGSQTIVGPKEQNFASLYATLNIPPGAQLIGNPTATSYTIGIKEGSPQASNIFTVRYPKSLYKATDSITLSSDITCRYRAETLVSNCAAPLSITTTAGDASALPKKTLGTIDPKMQVSTSTLSEKTLLNGGGVPIDWGGIPTRVGGNSVIAELRVVSNGAFWVKNGVETKANYKVGAIDSIAATNLSGEDPLKPMGATVIYHYVDGDVTAYQKNGATNIAATTKPLEIDLKRELLSVEYIVTNVPAATVFNKMIGTGYVFDYPQSGADSLRFKSTITAKDYDGTPIQVTTSVNNIVKADVPITKTPAQISAGFGATIPTTIINPGSSFQLQASSGFITPRNHTFESILNPQIDILLPIGTTYVSNNINFTVIGMDEAAKPMPYATEPVVEVVNNFNGTGQQLVRLKYTGLYSQGEIIGSSANITMNVGTNVKTGNYAIECYVSGDNVDFSKKLVSSSSMSVVSDTNDIDGNPITTSVLNTTRNFTVTRGQGTYVYTTFKGANDPVFATQVDVEQGSVVDGKLTLEYDGTVAMKNIQLVTALPFEGDTKSQWGNVDDGQRITLVQPVDMSAYPGAIVYYNNDVAVDPKASGWSTTFSTDAKSVRVDFPSNIELVLGGLGIVEVPMKLSTPTTTSFDSLPTVAGTGVYSLRAYASTVIPPAGMDSDISRVNTIPTAIKTVVFNDINKNGIKDVNESYINNNSVEVYETESRKLIASGNTDMQGTYTLLPDSTNTLTFSKNYDVEVKPINSSFVFTTQVGDVTTDTAGVASKVLARTTNVIAGQNGTFKLNFDTTNVESGPITPQNIAYNDYALEPMPPTKAGYNFTNWNTSADGTGTIWNFWVDKMPANDITLYPQFDPIEYNVSYDLNGGPGVKPADQKVAFNSLIPQQSAEPLNPPLVFGGWNTSVDGNGITWNFDTMPMPASDIKFYAIWVVPQERRVTYDLNGSNEPAPAVEIFTVDSLITRPQNPKWVGHTFIEWNTQADGNGSAWDYSTMKLPNNDITLYAQWQINQYEVNYNANGGVLSDNANITVDYGSTFTKPLEPINEGAKFISWNTKSDGTGINWDFNTMKMPPNNLDLYAVWEYNEYDVIFNLNGSDGVAIPNQKLTVKELATEPKMPTFTGHAFVEWNTSSDGSGTKWDFMNSKVPVGGVELFAIWSFNSYSVNYSLNGAPGTPPSREVVEFGQAITKPGDPSYAGHTFTGWYTTPDATGASLDFTTFKMPGNDVALYAGWSVNQYNISFDLNGKPGTKPIDQLLDYGSLVVQPADPKDLGYEFLGWNTNADGTGIMWDFDSNLVGEKDEVLYAIWTPVRYTVNFDLQGGTSPNAYTQYVYTNGYATKPAIPTKIGHTFTGWYRNSQFTSNVWDFANDVVPNQNITLYAGWKVNSHSVSFDANGGIGTVGSQVVNFDQLVTQPTQSVTKPGYSFTGWYLTPDASGAPWDFTTNKMPDNDLTLYAGWTNNTYNLSYDLNGGEGVVPEITSVVEGTLINNKPTDPTRLNYVFAGWYDNIEGSGFKWDFEKDVMPNSDLTLYAKWIENGYNVAFDANGYNIDTPASQIVAVDSLISRPTTPSLTGYSFVGWSQTSDNSSGIWNFSSDIMPSQDLTLYAIFSTNSYTVTYVTKPSTDMFTSEVVEYNTLVTNPGTPYLDGHKFLGFYTNEGVLWDFYNMLMPAGDITLTAKYEKIKYYTVTFDPNGATDLTVIEKMVQENDYVTKPDLIPSKIGFEFIGWTTTDGAIWDFDTMTVTSDIILSAAWQPIVYDVIFDVNGGYGSVESQQVEYNGYIKQPSSNPYKDGYSFVGWNTSIDGSGIAWNFNTMVIANGLTLYAQYVPDEVVPVENVDYKKEKLVETGDSNYLLIAGIFLITSSLVVMVKRIK